MRSDYERIRGGLLKQRSADFSSEPVHVPVGAMPAPGPQAAPEGAPGTAASAGAPHPEGAPQVQLHRAEDGSVRAITVRCLCGREITMQCEYIDEGGAQ